MDNYTLPAKLVQQILDILNELPARVSRGVLNDIEMECLAQQAAAKEQKADPA